MTGRTPTRRWKWPVALSLALGTTCAHGGWLLAQQPAPATPNAAQQAPTLPPTRVEGVPGQTPTTPQTNNFPQQNDPFNNQNQPDPNAQPSGAAGTAPLSSGGIFASPSVSGYLAPTATTGSIVDVPLLSLPSSVSVVPNAVFRDQETLRVDDILRDVSSATKLGDPRRPDNFTLRGFEVRARDYRWNGFVDPTPAPRDFANVERIEILKGPASILYGGGQPSGVVNLITKKPLAQSFIYGDVQGGNFGLFRSTVDATGPVNDDKSVLFRVNVAYQNNEGFRDFYFNEKTFVAPVLTWLIDEDTALTVEGSYLNDRRRYDTGVVAINGRVGVVPITQFYDQPNDFLRYNDYHASALLTHKFDENWSGRLGFFSNWHDSPFSATVPIQNGSQIDPRISGPLSQFGFNFDQNTLLRQRQVTPDFREQYYSVIGNVAGSVHTGPFEHKLVLGSELGWFNSTDFNAQFSDPLQPVPFPTPFGTFSVPFPSSPINVFHPTYNQPDAPLVGSYHAAYTQERYGFYIQDVMDLTHGLKLVGGVRGDIVEFSFSRSFASPFAGFDIGYPTVTTDTTYYHLTPRAGLVYEAVPEVLSFYGTYSQSFDPPSGGIYANPQPLKAETGRIVEGGVKADLFDKKLSLTAAGYYIIKDNVPTQSSVIFTTQIGSQRSQGFEVSAVGKLTDAWSIIANYSYIDSRILGDSDPTIVGNQFRGVPYNSANLWTRYNLIDKDCQTFGLAVGLVYLGNRVGDLQNSFQLPGYTRWDAGAYYRYKNLNANLYVENMFNREYYSSSVDQFTVYPGAPFTIRGTVGIKF